MAQNEGDAKTYQREKRIVSLGSTVLIAFSLTVIGFSPLSVLIRDYSFSHSENVWLANGIYFTLFSTILFVLDFPLDVYSGYVLEHRYGLSNLSFAGWFRETAKRQGLSFFFALVLIELLYGIIRWFPSLWWIVAWLAWIFVTIVMGKLWPVLIAPLFYKFERLNDDHLRRRIVDLVRDVKLKIENVYSMNMSKTTKKANAYFCGMGGTRRVVLSDTLIENFDSDEIVVVVAHEAGHCKRHHIWKGIFFSMSLSLVAFWLGYKGLTYWVLVGGLHGVDDIAAFPVLALFVVLFSFITMPLGNAFSRTLEREADDFAISSTRLKKPFVSAMQKLARVNLADPNPHPVIEFLFFSHPAINKRIARAEAFSQ